MPKTDRTRVDYMPCPAALQALILAREMYPDVSTQALIDRLVIVGLSALRHEHWRAPSLYGNRSRWMLPIKPEGPGKQSKEIKAPGNPA